MDANDTNWPGHLITINSACTGLVLIEALQGWKLTEQQADGILTDHPELTPDQRNQVLALVGPGAIELTRELVPGDPLRPWLDAGDYAWARKLQIRLD